VFPSVRALRWRAGVGAGNSRALRQAVSEAVQRRVRPIAYLPAVCDLGLRTERVDLPDPELAEALGASNTIGRLARDLSAGERQRVRLATALSSSVRFVALDEPCRHLDPAHVEALDSVLAARGARGDTVLAVCDRRQLLAATLFDEEIGTAAEAGPAPTLAQPTRGEPLALEVPEPCLLSALRRPSGKRRIEIERGALVVLRGPNGSGKTSLLRALSRSARAAGVRGGMSGQEPEHEVFASTPARELEAIIAAYGPTPWVGDDIAERLGLERWMSTPTPRLPLGVLSLLGVAIALHLGRDLVLLDEPTEGLDCRAARALARELVRCAGAGARIVVASHDPELGRVANRGWSVTAGRLNIGGAS
jgi:ABC-type multidrug transport system ATPase subunit